MSDNKLIICLDKLSTKRLVGDISTNIRILSESRKENTIRLIDGENQNPPLPMSYLASLKQINQYSFSLNVEALLLLWFGIYIHS